MGQDSDLVFWLKGDSGIIVDEVSGRSLIVMNNKLVYDSGVRALRADLPASSYSYSAYIDNVDLGITDWDFTVVVDVRKNVNTGNNFTTLDFMPTRYGLVGTTPSNLTTSFKRLACVMSRNNGVCHRKLYLDGNLILEGDITPALYQTLTYTGLAINYVANPLSFSSYYFKNLRLYKRQLKIDEINNL